jgi:hypothetical protein
MRAGKRARIAQFEAQLSERSGFAELRWGSQPDDAGHEPRINLAQRVELVPALPDKGFV